MDSVSGFASLYPVHDHLDLARLSNVTDVSRVWTLRLPLH